MLILLHDVLSKSVCLFISDEKKPVLWEDSLPRSNSVSSTTDTFNLQSTARNSNHSINSLPKHKNPYNLNTVNNNQETSFYDPKILSINSVINNNHLSNKISQKNIHSQNLNKVCKKLERTPSGRSAVSSDDSWCLSEDHYNDDISSYNENTDNLNHRNTSLISAARNSQLRLTFNKAKQHLSFDKWRHNPSPTMPSSNNQESPVEPLSRLSRWFSIRRGSHQYDLNTSTNSSHRSNSVDKENDEKLSTDKKMPQLQEVDKMNFIVQQKCLSELPSIPQIKLQFNFFAIFINFPS